MPSTVKFQCYLRHHRYYYDLIQVHGRCQALSGVVLLLYCATPGFLLSRLRGLACRETSVQVSTSCKKKEQEDKTYHSL